jgi:hypothetical protein
VVRHARGWPRLTDGAAATGRCTLRPCVHGRAGYTDDAGTSPDDSIATATDIHTGRPPGRHQPRLDDHASLRPDRDVDQVRGADPYRTLRSRRRIYKSAIGGRVDPTVFGVAASGLCVSSSRPTSRSNANDSRVSQHHVRLGHRRSRATSQSPARYRHYTVWP